MLNPVRSIVLLLIRGYQLGISPLMANRCRFYPSCSAYAMEAITRHGLLKGGYLSCRRLLHCHPFHPGGYDPVPDNQQTSLQASAEKQKQVDHPNLPNHFDGQ